MSKNSSSTIPKAIPILDISQIEIQGWGLELKETFL